MADVLLATCAELPAGDEDAAAVIDALDRLGIRAESAVWTDPRWPEATGTDGTGPLVVLRSVWDYPRDRPRFLDWVAGLSRVANPAEMITWNTDKLYLRDLADAGVPVVDTAFAAPGEPVMLPDSGEFVVKPSVGAGSYGAGRFRADAPADALAHAAHLHDAGRTVLVQPYLADVETAGETALMYFDGAFSHAVRKGPMLGAAAAHRVDAEGLYLEETITARRPSRAELEVGQDVLRVLRDRFGSDPLYARIDLLPAPAGPVVVEVELTEPSLFLTHNAAGDPADRFAAAIAARL